MKLFEKDKVQKMAVPWVPPSDFLAVLDSLEPTMGLLSAILTYLNNSP